MPSLSSVRLRLSVLLLFGSFLVLPALAQEPLPSNTEPAAQEPAAQEPAAQEPASLEVPESLASARATMRTFLEAFDAEKRPTGADPLDLARECLDLSQITEDLRQQQGSELAVQLKEVLDKTKLIDFQAISDRRDGPPYRLAVHQAGYIEIAADRQGRWLFTADTLEALPELLRQIRDRHVVEGVTNAGPLTFAQWARSRLPASLLKVTFLLENWQWLALLLLIFVGVVVDRLFTAAVQISIERYLKSRMEQIDPQELRSALRPAGLLVASLLWWPGLLALGLPVQILQTLVVAVRFVAITAFVWAAYRMVDIAAAVLKVRADQSENKFDDLLVPLFRKSAKIFIAALGFVFIADNLDIEITSLVAGLGIGGLALALAAQDAIKNLFGSLMVIVDQPFSVGDWVVVGDVEGTVVELGFRSTRIKTFYDSTVTLPNANLISAAVDNLGRRQYRRWKTHLSLTYDTPAEKLEAFCAGVRELVELHPYTRKDYYHVYVNQFSAASVDVLLYVFFECPDWATELRERHRLSLDVLRLAQDLGVEFAFPTQTLYLKRPEAETPLPSPAGYADRLTEAHGAGRDSAGRLVAGALRGEVPPPVGG